MEKVGAFVRRVTILPKSGPKSPDYAVLSRLDNTAHITIFGFHIRTNVFQLLTNILYRHFARPTPSPRQGVGPNVFSIALAGKEMAIGPL